MFNWERIKENVGWTTQYLRNDGLLVLMSLMLIFITPLDYILYIKWIDSMEYYNWYASSFIFPLFGIFSFYVGTKYLENKGLIKEENKMEQRPLQYMGIMDGLNSTLGSVATPYLSIIVMTILDKFSLPLIVASSILFLKRGYLKNHYLGVFLTIYAIMVSYLPNFSDGTFNEWWATLLFIVSLIPAVGSYILKEKYLDNRPIDIWWMNLWVCIWQFTFGLVMFPIMLIPFGEPGKNHIPSDNIWNYLKGATVCQFTSSNYGEHDHCENSLLLMICYQLISTLINVLMLYIIRKGSSTYFVIINSLKIPIQAWLASYRELAGPNYKPINANDLFSFLLLIVATLIYNDQDEIKFEKKFKPLITLDEEDYDDSLIMNNISDKDLEEEGDI
jgi:drug/metabolite transporter (DMT)-like permease